MRLLSVISSITFASLASSFILAIPVNANTENRTISVYEIHTKETTTVTFKKNGKFVPEALKKLNWALRDWRRNLPTKMSPELIDLVWKIHKDVGSKKPIHVISGYRSPKTNAALRRTRGGQARRSQHMLGRAMDIHFPDVPVKKLRESAMVKQKGGVGYYPTSAIPFVHVDVARVRAWPRMSRFQLATLFPYGKTRHIPSDGRPLTVKDQIKARIRLAKLNRKKKPTSGYKTQLARAGGVGNTPSLRKSQKPVNIALGLKNSRSFQLPGRQAKNRHFGKLWVNKKNSEQRYAALLESSGGNRPNLNKQKPSGNAVVASLSPSWIPSRNPKNIQPQNNGQQSKSPFSLTEPLRKNSNDRTQENYPSLRSTYDTLEGPANQALTPESVAYSPGFDEEHPDELAYRPFQLLPLLVSETVANDKSIARMEAPNYEQASLLVERVDRLIPMQFRSSDSAYTMSGLPKFKGKAVGGLPVENHNSSSITAQTRTSW